MTGIRKDEKKNVKKEAWKGVEWEKLDKKWKQRERKNDRPTVKSMKGEGTRGRNAEWEREREKNRETDWNKGSQRDRHKGRQIDK